MNPSIYCKQYDYNHAVLKPLLSVGHIWVVCSSSSVHYIFQDHRGVCVCLFAYSFHNLLFYFILMGRKWCMNKVQFPLWYIWSELWILLLIHINSVLRVVCFTVFAYFVGRKTSLLQKRVWTCTTGNTVQCCADAPSADRYMSERHTPTVPHNVMITWDSCHTQLGFWYHGVLYITSLCFVMPWFAELE